MGYVEDAVEIVTAILREQRATTDRRPPDEVIADVVSGGRAASVLGELARLSASLLQEVAGHGRFARMDTEDVLRHFTLRFG